MTLKIDEDKEHETESYSKNHSPLDKMLGIEKGKDPYPMPLKSGASLPSETK